MLQRGAVPSDRRVITGRSMAAARRYAGFRLHTRFGLIVIAFNSFMHLTTQRAQEQALRVIARHLRPDGRVIVDLFNPARHARRRQRGARSCSTVSTTCRSGRPMCCTSMQCGPTARRSS